MHYPRTLPEAVFARSFRASNGELGVLQSDVPAFLDACLNEGVDVLGWELWMVDHSWNPGSNMPAASVGQWSGLIPIRGESLPRVFSSTADLRSTRWQVADLDLQSLIEPQWLDYIRVNLTIA